MDKKEFVKRWKKGFDIRNIELYDGSVIQATRFVYSEFVRGHIKLFFNENVIGHVPICSIADVF